MDEWLRNDRDYLMRQRLLSVLLFCLVLGGPWFPAPSHGVDGPPSNERFDDALPLIGSNLIATGSNVGASLEASETGPLSPGDPGGKTVWWKWTAPVSGKATISTGGSNFDTVLGLYSGATLVTRVQLAVNDDNPGGGTFTSRIDYDVVAGTEYHIVVDGLAGGGVAASGNIVLTIGMNNVAATLAVQGVTNNQFGLTITGGVGNSYRLEATPDLKNWETIHRFVPTNTTTLFDDPLIPGKRFYRVVTPDVVDK